MEPTLYGLLEKLLLGAYLFTAGCYGWAWVLYKSLAAKITHLHTNHLHHLDERIAALEQKVNQGPPQGV